MSKLVLAVGTAFGIFMDRAPTVGTRDRVNLIVAVVGLVVVGFVVVVQITAKPGESFIDRMIALVEGASRQKTPNEIALNILLASLTVVFLVATATLQPFAVYAGAEHGHMAQKPRTISFDAKGNIKVG